LNYILFFLSLNQQVNSYKTKAKSNGKHIEESDTDELEKELVNKSKYFFCILILRYHFYQNNLLKHYKIIKNTYLFLFI